jgi:hypothetical protein
MAVSSNTTQNVSLQTCQSVILLFLFVGLPIHCDHYWSVVPLHLSSNHFWFSHQSSLAVTSKGTYQRSWRNLVRNVREICLQVSIFILQRSLTCKMLRHGTAGFTSPPKEVVLRIFIALKIYLPRPSLNPRTLGPVVSTIITRPSRASHLSCSKFLLMLS